MTNANISLPNRQAFRYTEANMKPTIYLGADHAGWALKQEIETYLRSRGHGVVDMGNEHLVSDDDYPDFGYAVAKRVVADPEARGIVLCGNAQGMCMVANKVKGVRAATGFAVDEAKTSRTDDNSNVLCLPARFINNEESKKIVDTWIETPFSDAERHVRRLKKMEKIETEEFKQ